MVIEVDERAAICKRIAEFSSNSHHATRQRRPRANQMKRPRKILNDVRQLPTEPSARIKAEANAVEILRGDSRGGEAEADCLDRKRVIEFSPGETFLLGSGDH